MKMKMLAGVGFSILALSLSACGKKDEAGPPADAATADATAAAPADVMAATPPPAEAAGSMMAATPPADGAMATTPPVDAAAPAAETPPAQASSAPPPK